MNIKKVKESSKKTVKKPKLVVAKPKKTAVVKPKKALTIKANSAIAKTSKTPTVEKVVVNKELANAIAVKKDKNKVSNKSLLSIENLDMLFKVRGWYFKALDNISFSVNEGDFFGIIGESGSGKSTTGKCIIKLYQPSGGKIEIDGNLVSNKRLTLSTKKWLRKNVQMIFQDPMASLNPTKNILQLIAEPLIINRSLYIDAFKRWQELNNVSKHFFIQFSEEKRKIVYDFKKSYFTTMIQKLKESREVFEKSDLSNETFSNGREKLIFNLDTFVEKINESTNAIYFYSQKFKNLVNSLTKQYFDKGYDKLNKKSFFTKDYLIYGEEVRNAKEICDLAKEELERTKEKYHETNVKNFQYLKSAKLTTKGKIKSIEQNISFSRDELSYTLNYIDLYAKRINLHFINSLLKFKNLSLNLINEITEKSSIIINELFNPFIDLINKMNFLFEKVDIQGKNNIIVETKEIRKIVNDLCTSYKKGQVENFEFFQMKIERASYKPLLPKIFNSENLEMLFNHQKKYFSQLNQFFEKAKEENFNNLNLEKENILMLAYKFQEALKNFKEIYTQQKNQPRTEEQLSEKDLAILKFKEANSKFSYQIKKDYENSLSEEERNRILEEEKQRVAELNALLNEFKQEKHLIKNIIHSQLRILRKTLVSEQKISERNFIKKCIVTVFDRPFNFSFLNREVNLRWKSLSAIEFEYKNVISEIKWSSFICEQIRYINWVALKKFISLIKKERVYDALDSVGLKREHAYRYPHEFSGGQRQRIVIARALINKPKIIIADEPISALDVSIQAQIINILQDLCIKQKVTILFIAHDLSMVNYACNNVIIMHRGRILEKGSINKIFNNPIHPYTRSLMKATPKLSRVHVDLAAFNENFTYDKDWDAFNKPSFIKINGDAEHQVYGTLKQVSKWEKEKLDNE